MSLLLDTIDQTEIEGEVTGVRLYRFRSDLEPHNVTEVLYLSLRRP